MKKAPLGENDPRRIEILNSLDLLNNKKQDRFDAITSLLAERLHVPISTITVIDNDKEIYKASCGITEKDGPRDISFCGHALFASDLFVVEDTLKDERFKDNPYVIGEKPIRFYMGMHLKHRETSVPIGVLCVKDYTPRTPSMEEIGLFMEFAKEAEYELNNNSVKTALSNQ